MDDFVGFKFGAPGGGSIKIKMQRRGSSATQFDVLTGGPMTSFTGNPEFSNVGIDGASGSLETRFDCGGVATAANDVPRFGTVIEARRTNESGVARNPAFLGNEPGEREADLQIAGAFGNPEDLHVVGTGDQSHAGFDAMAHAFAGDRFHADPKFVGFGEESEAGVVVCEHYVIEIGNDGCWRGDLRHRAVISSMPRGVLVFVAIDTRLRADVIAHPNLWESLFVGSGDVISEFGGFFGRQSGGSSLR